MKKFMNVRFGALVAAILIAGSIAACGGGGGNDTSPTVPAVIVPTMPQTPTPPDILKYDDVVVAMWTEGFPFLVTKTSVTRMTNSTGQRLGSCGAANKPLPSGYLLFECTVVGGTFQRNRYLANPATGIVEIMYTGDVPVDITFTVSESSSTQPVVGTTAVYALGGWFYANPNDRWHLLFQPDIGGAPATVKEGTFAVDGTIKILRAYSN